MNIAKWIAAGLVALMMSSGIALAAEDCTDEKYVQRATALEEYLQLNPKLGPLMDDLAKSVEAKYGGKPTDKQRCTAMDELMIVLKNNT